MLNTSDLEFFTVYYFCIAFIVPIIITLVLFIFIAKNHKNFLKIISTYIILAIIFFTVYNLGIIIFESFFYEFFKPYHKLLLWEHINILTNSEIRSHLKPNMLNSGNFFLKQSSENKKNAYITFSKKYFNDENISNPNDSLGEKLVHEGNGPFFKFLFD